ncbi:MAG: DUF971 domain-containing protein [Gammaproteobacteria bacterium]|nr:DUF971 domain-containing protein [Gammaproteobacteria bacterium]MDH3506083.1 DUF971 domain-containing protein [Gammaproteobacteria bacterium]
MADSGQAPIPTALKLKRVSRRLEATFSDGSVFDLPAEYLRVYSPSAEVTGHGVGEGVLVTGKRSVNIERVEPVGRYAVKLVFDDGHDTGLYTWETLYELGSDYDAKWQRYLDRLEKAGEPRPAT